MVSVDVKPYVSYQHRNLLGFQANPAPFPWMSSGASFPCASPPFRSSSLSRFRTGLAAAGSGLGRSIAGLLLDDMAARPGYPLTIAASSTLPAGVGGAVVHAPGRDDAPACARVCVCVFLSIHAQVCVCIHTCTFINMCVYVCVCIHMCTCINACACVCVCVCARARACVHVDTWICKGMCCTVCTHIQSGQNGIKQKRNQAKTLLLSFVPYCEVCDCWYRRAMPDWQKHTKPWRR